MVVKINRFPSKNSVSFSLVANLAVETARNSHKHNESAFTIKHGNSRGEQALHRIDLAIILGRRCEDAE
jgi:hypothetical protein